MLIPVRMVAGCYLQASPHAYLKNKTDRKLQKSPYETALKIQYTSYLQCKTDHIVRNFKLSSISINKVRSRAMCSLIILTVMKSITPFIVISRVMLNLSC